MKKNKDGINEKFIENYFNNYVYINKKENPLLEITKAQVRDF